MEFDFIRPEQWHAEVIAENMREVDKAEVWASNRHTPLQALEGGMAFSSHSSTVIECDTQTPFMMLGLCTELMPEGVGVCWMLATDLVMKYQRELLRVSPGVVNDMLEIRPFLFNYVHAENRSSVRWLKWLGFRVEPAQPYGIDDNMFHRFSMEKDDV